MGIGWNGKKAWVYGPVGLLCADEDNVRRVLSAGALDYRHDTARGAIITAHGEGGHLVRGDGELLAFDGEGAVRPTGRRVYALTNLDNERWAVAVREGREVVLRVGLRGAENVRLRSPKASRKLEAPVRWLRTDPPFTRKKRFSENVGRLRLSACEGALAMADADSGLIARWDEGTMDWRFAFRFPATERSELEAHPWGDGVVVAIRTDSGEGCLVELSPDGEVKASLSVQHLGTSALQEGAIVFTDGPNLRRWQPGEDPTTLLTHDYLNHGGQLVATAPDKLLLQQSESTYWLERAPEGPRHWYARPLPTPTGKGQPLTLAKTTYPRRKGPPQLELDGREEPTPWKLQEGPASLLFPLVMMGGGAEGLVVEIGGPGRALFTATTVVIEGEALTTPVESPFSQGTAQLGAVLPAGVELPDPPKSVARRKADAKAWKWDSIPEDCRFLLRIDGEATREGNALLTVRIGFLEHGRTGSLLRGQTLQVGH